MCFYSPPSKDERRRASQRRRVQLHPCVSITLLVFSVIFFITLIYTIVSVKSLRNRADYYRYCIVALERNVLPLRNSSELLEPAPISYGYWSLDYGQLEVRWGLADAIQSTVPNLASITVRGPLDHAQPYVGEVAFAMGLQKDKKGRHFEGVEDITGDLADDIIDEPYNYYVSFEDSTGREVARDSLSKECNDNR